MISRLIFALPFIVIGFYAIWSAQNLTIERVVWIVAITLAYEVMLMAILGG